MPVNRPAQIGRLADRDDAVLADRDRAVGDDVPIFVESEHNAVLDQDIDIFHYGLVSGASANALSYLIGENGAGIKNAGFHFQNDVRRLLEITLPFRVRGQQGPAPFALGERV